MESLIKKNRIFFNRIAKHYDFGIFKKWQEKIKRIALGMIAIKDNSKILDAGCGTGSLLSILSKTNPRVKLYGIDISSEMLKIARKKLGRKANLELSSVEELSKKEYYDYIFSSDAFHHYANQELAMQNFYQALKKGGYLIVLDVDFGIFNSFFHKIEPGNSKMNSSLEFRNLFRKHNFKEIKQKRVGLINVITIGRKS